MDIRTISDWRHPHVIDGKPVPLAKDWFRHWHTWRWSIDLPVIKSALGGISGKSVLDVGCNDGWYSFQAAAAGANAVGVEGRPDAVERANALREHYQTENARFVLGNVEDATSVSGSYDATLCYGLLYHLADPITVMRRLGAVTSRLICVQTFIHALDRSPTLHLLREGVGLPGKGLTELVTTPTQRAVVMMLNEAGFNHVYRGMPTPYLAAKFNSHAAWQWAFFYGVKGAPLDVPNVVEIHTGSPPLNHFGPISRLIRRAEVFVRRRMGRDTLGGF